MSRMRLDKIVAEQLAVSRSEARLRIKGGRIAVNGMAVRDPASAFETDTDRLFADGEPVLYKSHLYLMMNKPSGVLSAARDPSCQTVLDLVEERFRRQRLAPVGRLDKTTTGLLLLTDDGAFAHRVISPKSKIPKTYLARTDGVITSDIVRRFQEGITLADGAQCLPAECVPIAAQTARVTVTEGKYHQIKRMFGACGLGVDGLHRESIGRLVLPPDLLPGETVEIAYNCLKNLIF